MVLKSSENCLRAVDDSPTFQLATFLMNLRANQFYQYCAGCPVCLFVRQYVCTVCKCKSVNREHTIVTFLMHSTTYKAAISNACIFDIIMQDVSKLARSGAVEIRMS